MEMTIEKKKDLIPEEKQHEEDKMLLRRYLGQYYRCKLKKVQLERRLKEVNWELNEPIGGRGYSQMPRSQTNVVGVGAASITYRIAEIEERIQHQKDNMELAMLKIMDIMDYLPEDSTDRMILELRHIDCRSWGQVVKEASLTRTPCNDYYNKGLEKLLTFKKVRKILENYKKLLDMDE
jgi:hypothetical protein